MIGVTYAQTLTATGGDEWYTWSISSGALPDGLILDWSGTISGTPTVTGTFIFAVSGG